MSAKRIKPPKTTTKKKEPTSPKARGKLGGHNPAPAAAAPVPARRFVKTVVEIEGREETKFVELPSFTPDPWTDDAELSVVGTREPRRDGMEKATGQALYTSDIRRPGMLYAVILRAPIARGTLLRLDFAPALALPGVRAAIARADVPQDLKVGGVPLFTTDVAYAGQPVGALCADSEEIARRAALAVVAEYEPLPHAATLDLATARGAPNVRGSGSNRSRNSPVVVARGHVARGLAEAAVVVTREYRTPVALHSALEPHGAVAEWHGGRLTVWEATQGIFNTRSDLAEELGLALTDVRVLQEHLGGGFGAKNGASTNAYVAALLARVAQRPVRCVNDREAEQMDSGNRPATVQRVTLGARRDGTLTAIVVDAEIPLGIGGWQGGPAKIYQELYACENVRTSETFVYVNASAMSSFRAPGHAEGAFGLERAMDALARELGIDPLDLRLLNYAERDQQKGRPYTTKRLDACYREGAERFGWRGRSKPTADGRVRRGFGVASQIWGGGGGPPAYALCRSNPDGTFDVLTGTQDLGTGSRTVFAQVAAEALGAPLTSVRVVLGDTERTPYTGNSWGSMTVPSVAPAVRMAAEDCRNQLLEAAAGLLDSQPSRLDVADGVVAIRGGGKSTTYAEIGEALGDVMIVGHGSRGPNPDGKAVQAFGAQFAEVEVDEDTGIVRVVRIVAAHDAGRILNPTLAESQLEGGIIQGIGYALFEERVLDVTLGVPLNPTMHDYKVPTLADIPRIEAFFVSSSDPEANHTGVKGLAEPPIIPTAPAIANAVADALGVEIDEIPLTPWRVLRALGR
jgi:xanthine dehydrogenase YagR molybdenum-binding subunit